MDSSANDCLCLSPPKPYTILRLPPRWFCHEDLLKFEPPRAALSSQVFAKILKDLETVERVFDVDGPDAYMNERSLHILTLVKLKLAVTDL